MGLDFQGSEVSRVPGQAHLPQGLVTFLFTDIEGSTRLAQLLGAGYRPLLVEHRRVLRAALTAQAGIPLFCEGDSLFVVFADAAHAVRACVAAQQALAAHDWSRVQARPHVRMGLHTGYAEPHAGEYASPEVHRAARITDAAHGSQVLCSAATAQAITQSSALPEHIGLLDLGLHQLRGFDGRQRLFQLAAPGLRRTFPKLRTVRNTAHNLPAEPTALIGRVAEQKTLTALAQHHRLVTVVGPPGVGKTRVTVRVAAGLISAHPDGVWYVDLAPVTDAHGVPHALATGLGLRPEPGRPVLETLVEQAASRQMLLVLDTCDVQPAAVGHMVDRLLAAGPGVRVLAASREPMGMAGEVVWRLSSLPVAPGVNGEPSDAARLLLERVSAARGGEHPPPTDIEQLGQVACRLDGLPLALELAAPRMRVLSVSEFATRLDKTASAHVVSTVDGTRDGTRSTTHRHASLEATFGWSYRTLPPDPARLLRWLSVFTGPVDLPTITWLADNEPLGALTTLVDKSLVHVESFGPTTTYRMLAPLRSYASARLAETGEDKPAHDRHVAWTLHTLASAHRGPNGQPTTLNTHTFDPLAGEVRAALRWSADQGSARQGLRIAIALDQWWRERGLAAEGRSWLRRLYVRMATTGEDVPDTELARAYQMHAMHAGADGDHAEEMRFLQRAEATAARTNDTRLLLRVRAGTGMALVHLGSPTEAERACRSVLATARDQDTLPDALYAIYCLAQLLLHRGELDEAAELLAAARPAEAARPADRGRRTVDMILGMVALARGDLVAAHDHLTVALRSRMAHGFRARAAQTLSGFAARCAVGEHPLVAARLFGAAQAARTRLRSSAGSYGDYWVRQQNNLRVVLGDGAFDAAYAEGAGLTLDGAVALALTIEHPDLAAHSARFTHADSPTA